MPSINQKYRAVVTGMALVLAAPVVFAKSTIKNSTEKNQKKCSINKNFLGVL